MKNTKVKLAIVGAGTAGLYAFREAKKESDSVVLINGGPYGTTCARVGCMPSKAFIQAAHDYHRREHFAAQGIEGSDKLSFNIPRCMEHVRELRDLFVGGVMQSVAKVGEANIEGYAKFIDKNTLDIDGQIIEAEKIIIATGSTPVFPESWQNCSCQLLNTDNFFEQKDFPKSMAVMGAGVIGLELGQALRRMGVQTTIIGSNEFIGGLSDPIVNAFALEIFNEECNMMLGARAELNSCGNKLNIKVGPEVISVDKALLSIGRRPNVDKLALKNIGVELDKRGMPKINPRTLNVEGTNIYFAGDVNGLRPVMHEAADDGRIAAYNAVRENDQCFQRRSPLLVTFSDPQIAIAGKAYKDLDLDNVEIGQMTFDDNGRARIMGYTKGIIRIYVNKSDGLILGAEMIGPEVDFMGHVIAWLVQSKSTVDKVMNMPFYHPTVMESLRAVMYDLARKLNLETTTEMELAPCDSLPGSCFN